MSDNVYQPPHYTAGGIETIDYIAAKLGDDFRAYCIGNVLKYVSRYKHKNGTEDLLKASVYLAWAINGERVTPAINPDPFAASAAPFDAPELSPEVVDLVERDSDATGLNHFTAE